MFSGKKRANKKSDIRNIVTLNAYEKKYYIYKEELLYPLQKLVYNKTNYIVSFLSHKDIIATKVQLSRNIPEEDIPSILEIKAYEELGLDQASSYHISYYEEMQEGDERYFHLFVTEIETMDEMFLPIRNETKYIDLIVPEPLLYKPLYTKEILVGGGVDCFVYFTKKDASITFYKDGRYLYSKSLDFSLEQIYDKFCEIEGEQVDKEHFLSILETEGLKATEPNYQQNFMKIFGEVFIAINDIIIYTKRAYQLDNINHVYIGSQQGPIIGLDEYSHNYLGLPSADFNFDYKINSDEWYTDQYQFLMLLTGMEYMQDPGYVVNMSTYPRPPSFLNRASGQFIITTFAAITIGLGYPLYYLINAYLNNAQIYVLSAQEKKLKAEANKYKRIIGQKRKTLSGLDKELARLSQLYGSKTRTLQSIYKEKVDYRLKSGVYYVLAETLAKFNVYVDKIVTKDDTVYLSLVGEDDLRLTSFIRYITDKHYDDIKSIDIERIEKKPDDNVYRGLLKVELR